MRKQKRSTQIIGSLYEFDGHDKFFRKIIEEANEFAAEVSHFMDDKSAATDLACEHADVLLQLLKLNYYMDNIYNFKDYEEMVNTQLAIKLGGLRDFI